MSSTESATITGHSRYTGGDTSDDSKQDTRRYGTLLPAQIAEGLSFMYPDEEDSGTYTDFQSSWEFTPASTRKSKLSGITHTTEVQGITRKYPVCPTRTTEAQKIADNYLQTHDGNTKVQQSIVVRASKELPMLPDHRNSTYTVANTDDGQSTIDLEKRPEPAIRLFLHDRGGLAQAQYQGMKMVQAGHCTPGGNIRCQRPGCTDVLRDLEALKFHLHIHNIGDLSDATSATSAYSKRTEGLEHSRVQSPPLKQPTGKAHNRSKSSVEIDSTSCQSRTHRTTRSHAKDPSFLADSRNTSATRANSSASHTRTKTPPKPRGRRSNRGNSRNDFCEAGYNDSIAMVLSRPTSPELTSQEVLSSKTNPPLGSVNYNSSFSPIPSPGRGEKDFLRPKSPKRAFSPARALSPIRDGLRRVFSLGCLKCS